ncbi:hypothetical protein [Mycolicibacterium sp. HS_4_1]
MLRSTSDMLLLRWRTAQLLRAVVHGDAEQARALREAMRIEKLDGPDISDEMSLLVRQFGHRPIWALTQECARLWLKVSAICVHCHRISQQRDNAGVCAACITKEAS